MGFEDRPTIENKSEIGNSAEETRNKIIKSGIAERILYLMKKYKPKLDPEITFGIEDCNFMVEVIQDPGEEKHVRIVIEHPNLMQRGSSMVEGAYGVEKGVVLAGLMKNL